MERKTFKDALIDAWDALIPMVGLNLTWFVLTLLVVTAFPALGGLYYATNRIAHGESADIKTFFEGFKEQFWVSWKYGIANLVVYLLLIVNVWFYGRFEGFWFVVIQSLFLSVILMWTCMQFYVYPFLLEQAEPSLKTALKNSFAVFVRFMGRSFGLLLFFILVATISVLLPPLWIVITVSFMVFMTNAVTLTTIYDLRKTLT